jgi:diamine N-acetyltransferase
VHPSQQRFIADYFPVAAIALAKAYIRPGRLVWVPYAIYADQDMVGFTELAYEPESRDPYWIYHFFIDRAHQRKGYGKQALRALIGLVKESHPFCEHLRLSVHPDNTVAQHLYTSVGFRPTGEMLDNSERVYNLVMK